MQTSCLEAPQDCIFEGQLSHCTVNVNILKGASPLTRHALGSTPTKVNETTHERWEYHFRLHGSLTKTRRVHVIIDLLGMFFADQAV